MAERYHCYNPKHMATFVQNLENYVTEKLSSLDLLKEPEIGPVDRSEIVRRLKMALKNELEASEIAAVWIPTTPEVEVKLALARQVGDEAKHYRLIEEHLDPTLVVRGVREKSLQRDDALVGAAVLLRR